MNRDQGLRRVTTVTAGMAGVSIVGVVIAATAAAHHTTASSTSTSTSTSTTTSNSTTGSDSTSGSDDSSTTNSGSSDSTYPGLSQGNGQGGHATSGGS